LQAHQTKQNKSNSNDRVCDSRKVNHRLDELRIALKLLKKKRKEKVVNRQSIVGRSGGESKENPYQVQVYKRADNAQYNREPCHSHHFFNVGSKPQELLADVV